MEFRKNTSTNQWLDFWLSKYSSELEKQKLTLEVKKSYLSLATQYLTLNPGNPRAIEVDKLEEFLNTQKPENGMALTLFYEHIALSRDHLDVIEKYDAKKQSPKKK